MNGSNPTERLLDALRSRGYDPRPCKGGWSCRCPAHDDRNPSLSIAIGDNGGAVVKCHAKCKTEDVLAAVGLTMRDIMPDRDGSKPSRRSGHGRRVGASPVPEPSPHGRENFGDGDTSRTCFPSAEAAVAKLEQRYGPHSDTWTYRDAAGKRVGLVVRWDPPEGGKRIRPVSLRGSGWVLGGMPTPRPLYNLPELASTPPGSTVFVCEGEKAADAVAACDLIATTSPHGSKSAGKADWSPLAGHDVMILPDHDDAGERYAADVSSLAVQAGARSVRVVRLADRWDALPEGGDAADVLEIEGGDIEAFRAGLEALTAHAEAIEPADAKPFVRFVPFPVDVLPEPVRSYVIETAKAINCDPCYVALPILASLASAIGNTHQIRLKRSWAEPAIIWTAIVGVSGTAKSPALEKALRPVKTRQHRAMKEHERAMKEWRKKHERWEVKYAAWKKSAAKGNPEDPPEAPEKPVCPRTWTDDTTTEALVVLLKENPRGLLMVRDELGGWFSFDRYTGGRGGGDAAKWLEVFGGRSLIVDRKTSGTEYVPHASVSIAGGIQPETLRRVLGQEHRDNGLAARLLFAMPPRRPKKWTEDDVSEKTEAALDALFDRLYALKPETDPEGEPQPRLIPLDADAKRVWVQFVNEHGAEQADRTGDEAAMWSKLEGYAARFALVIHLVRVAAGDPTIGDPSTIDAASIEAGVALARWFANEAERVYAWLDADDEAREQDRLLEWIAGRGGSVTVRDLTKGMRRFRGKTAEARAALEKLVNAGYGRWDHTPKGSRGRPSERFVMDESQGYPHCPRPRNYP